MNRESFEEVVSQMENAKAQGLQMKSLMVSSPEGAFAHTFGQPSTLTDLRSISKVAVAMVLGIAMSSGVTLQDEPISLEMKIWPFFLEFAGRQIGESRRNLEAVRLRHLLSNTMGHREGFLFRSDVQGRDLDSLLSYIFSQQLEFPPGSHFSYSNVGWYLVSAMIKNELGISLSRWVSESLFDRIEIGEFSWTKYGEYDAGATGLALSNHDLHKLGQLLLEDGRYKNEQLVPRAWIETIRAPVIRASSGYDPSSPLQATAYGYGIWVCDDGTYYCDGSGGQFLIVVPEKRLVVTALAGQGDTLLVSSCLRPIL